MAELPPQFKGFIPVGESSDFGVVSEHYLRPEDGVRLQLSEFGAARVEDPAFAELLAKTIGNVAGEGIIYKPQIVVPESGLTLYKVADLDRDRRNTVYGSPETDTVIKAGLVPGEIPIEFGFMNLLHKRLEGRGGPVRAVAQYALIHSTDGLPTSLMQHAKGASVQSLLHQAPREMKLSGGTKAERTRIFRLVQHELTAAIGAPASRLLANDIGQNRDIDNIFTEGQLTDIDTTYTVIDQPRFINKFSARALSVAYAGLRKVIH